MAEERRNIYRVSPSPKRGGTLALFAKELGESATSGAGGEPGVRATRVIDVNITGVGGQFPLDETESFNIGDPVALHLEAVDSGRAVDIVGVVMGYRDLTDHRHFGFRFEDATALAERLPAELCKLFNRRSVPRIRAPKDEPPIPVKFSPHTASASQPRGHFDGEGRLGNLSASGIGVLLAAEVNEALAHAQKVDLSIDLALKQGPIRVVAEVVNRIVDGDKLYCGLRYDPVLTENFLDKQQILIETVMARINDSR